MSDTYFDRVEAELARLTREGAHLRTRQTSHGRLGGPAQLFSAIGAAASVGVVAAIVVLALGTHRAAMAPTTAPSPTAPGAASALVANFRLLRRPEQTGDGGPVGLGLGTCPIPRTPTRLHDTNPLIPNATRRVVVPCGDGPTALQRRYGLENPPGLPIRHVSIPTTRIQTWLIAGSRGACWNAVGPQPGHVIGERCFPAAGVGRRILVGTVPRVGASGFEIGLVTDTARAVELRRRDGTTKVLSLANGYFYTTYHSGDEILADTGSGVRVIQTFVAP
jgi:hypothetical protein